MKKEFSDLNLSRCTNEEAATLYENTCVVVAPIVTEMGEMGGHLAADLIATSGVFAEQAIQSTKSELTDPMNAVRRTCDEVISEIKSTITIGLKSRDAAKKADTQKVDFLFRLYWDLSKKAIEVQQSQTVEMMDKYKADPLLVIAAQSAGVKLLMTELDTNNLNLGVIFLKRNEEIGQRKESATKLRVPATASYMGLCSYLEQLVNFRPTEALLTLFTSMDTLRKRAHSNLAAPTEPGETPAE